MKVTVKYFASIREAIGQGSELRETSALNQVMSDETAVLNDGCEVAFFPPVTGG